MADEKGPVLSKLTCRHFYESRGFIGQIPEEAMFYRRLIKYEGKFLITLRVKISLIHGLNGGGDAGKDIFWVTLAAVDIQRKNMNNRRRVCSITYRPFDNIDDFIAWLRSPHLEDSIRAGIVTHPPAPTPSPERSLARALFIFADDIENLVKDLDEDLQVRQNLRFWRKKESGL